LWKPVPHFSPAIDFQARYFAGVRAGGDVPLSQIKYDEANDGWWSVASGKGVLLLAELRRLMGDAAFVSMMDEFGRRVIRLPRSAWRLFWRRKRSFSQDKVFAAQKFFTAGCGEEVQSSPRRP
jgi:hypothetical protein